MRPTVVLAASLLLVAMLAGCAAGDDEEPEGTATAAATEATTSTPEGTAGATSEGTAGAGGGANVFQAGIANSTLPNLTVPAGATVTWTNRDDVPHTVTADDGSFDSGEMTGTFEHTFTTAGRYAYHCEIHESITGTILVQ